MQFYVKSPDSKILKRWGVRWGKVTCGASDKKPPHPSSDQSQLGNQMSHKFLVWGWRVFPWQNNFLVVDNELQKQSKYTCISFLKTSNNLWKISKSMMKVDRNWQDNCCQKIPFPKVAKRLICLCADLTWHNQSSAWDLPYVRDRCVRLVFVQFVCVRNFLRLLSVNRGHEGGVLKGSTSEFVTLLAFGQTFTLFSSLTMVYTDIIVLMLSLK